MSIQMDPPRSPVPAIAQVLAEAALQRQNMLLGAGNGGTSVAAPTPGASSSPTPAPATALAPPPLPERSSDPALTDRVSLSPRASQALQAQGQGGVASPHAALAQPRGVPVPPAATLAVAAVGGVPGVAWPAGGVSAPMRGLLNALVQQLTSAAPQRVVVAQPWEESWGHAGEAGTSADADVPPLQTWLVGQGQVLTEQGARSFTATLRVPAAWLQALPQAPLAAEVASVAPAPSALQTAFAGQAQALAGGVFALVLQPGAHAEGLSSTSAVLSLELASWTGTAGALVYGRDQLQARNDPWLQMLALQASGYGREEEEADQRRRERGHCDAPGCPYAGRAPCEQPFCLALRVAPVQTVPPSSALLGTR